MLNSDFLTLVYGPEFLDDYGWVCAFDADPNEADGSAWRGAPYFGASAQRAVIDKSTDSNTYYSVAVMKPDAEGKKRRSKDCFVRLAVLVADDVLPQDLKSRASYVLETSEGNYQAGFFLDPADPDCRNLELIDRLMQRMAENKMVPQDASGVNAVRYVRLPGGRNKKAKNKDFQCKVYDVDKDAYVYSLASAAAEFDINLDAVKNDIPQLSIASRAEQFRDSVTVTGETAKLYQALMNPDPRMRSYHDPLLRMSAQMVASGMAPGAVVNHLRGLMVSIQPDAATEPEEFARWTTRMEEIVRMTMAARKYAPPALELDNTDLLINEATLADLTKDIKWLVEDLIPADAMGMVFGSSGTFKSFVILDLLMHVAHGKKWLGRETENGPVVYMAAEGGAGINRRLSAWRTHHAVGHSPNVTVCIVPLLLSLEEQTEALRSAIHKLPYKPKCVVIDTLAQTFAGDENSSSDISHYLRLLNGHIRAAFNCTVIVIHHTGHSATERPRGSSALIANLDFLLSLSKPAADSLHTILGVTKQKDGEKLKDITFKMERVDLGTNERGKMIDSLVATEGSILDGMKIAGKNPRGREIDWEVIRALKASPTGTMTREDIGNILETHYPDRGRHGGLLRTFHKNFIECATPIVSWDGAVYRALG